MLKNIHYITISLAFILILALFLLFNPDSYPVNAEPDIDLIIRKNNKETPIGGLNTKFAVISDGEGKVAENSILTLKALHQSYVNIRSLNGIEDYDVVIIATKDMGAIDTAKIKEFLSSGGHVIFAAMIDSPSEELMELIGVVSCDSGYKSAEFALYDGVFLGGLFHAEDTPVDYARVSLSGRCKVYADAYGEFATFTDDPPYVRKDSKSPIIWRTYYEGGSVYVINANFMEEFSGAGVLTGIISMAVEDFIYPVVGTKTVALDNFPYISDEGVTINDRSSYAFMRDVVWPDMVAAAKRLELTFTCFTNGDFSKNSESYNMLYFLNLALYKITKGELGYAANDKSFASYDDDMLFMRSNLPNYEVRSIFSKSGETGFSDNVTSIASNSWDGCFAWVNEGTIKLPFTSYGYDREDVEYAYASALTAFGYALHYVDFLPVYTGEENWNDTSSKIGKRMAILFSDITYLQASSLKDAAEKAKDYLNMEMDVSRLEGGMNVSILDNRHSASFILRSQKPIDMARSRNCEIERIEDGAYMIKSDKPDFFIAFIDNPIRG